MLELIKKNQFKYSLDSNSIAQFMHCCNNRDALTEVSMIHGLSRSQSGLMVVTQQLVQKVKSFRTDQVLVFSVNEPLPSLTGMSNMKQM